MANSKSKSSKTQGPAPWQHVMPNGHIMNDRNMKVQMGSNSMKRHDYSDKSKKK